MVSESTPKRSKESPSQADYERAVAETAQLMGVLNRIKDGDISPKPSPKDITHLMDAIGAAHNIVEAYETRGSERQSARWFGREGIIRSLRRFLSP